MRVLIAGGHGQIAMRLERMLTLRGDEAIGLVRNPDHAADLADVGATAVVTDLESASVDDVAPELNGVDAVVFAAGAGPGSGAPRKDTVDRGAAVLMTDAAERAGVQRYVLISAMGAGAEPPAGTGEVFATYLRAKRASEEDLRMRTLDWTVLRPGSLTDDDGTGRVELAPSVERGPVPREDVAAVVLGLLDAPGTTNMTLELVSGETPIDTAIGRLT